MASHLHRRSAPALLAVLAAGTAPPFKGWAEGRELALCGPVAHLGGDSGWWALGHGVEFRRLSLRFASDPGETRLLLLRLEPARLRVRVVAVRNEGGGLQTASDWGRRSGALAVINGGYFTPEGKPLGFLVTDGREVDQALQAGPLLIEGGRAAGGLARYRETSRRDLRAALALDGCGRVALFVTESGGRGLSWCEMQRFLLLPRERGGIGAREAMNLDGGNSAQLYLRVGGLEREVRGRRIPAAIAFYPRPEKGEAP